MSVREITLVDASAIIGLYPLCNTGTLVIHAMDDVNDLVQVSLNGERPEWYAICHDPQDGFYWGEMFVPFDSVLAVACA